MSSFSSFPYDIELMIFRYIHEMNMCNVRSELLQSMFLMQHSMSYLQKRDSISYNLFNRLYKRIDNRYVKTKIGKYIHYKGMLRCFRYIIKPTHIILE